MEELKRKCKKLAFSDEEGRSPKVLLGIIVSEDQFFIKFRTARRDWRISKKNIVSIQDTNRNFIFDPEFFVNDEYTIGDKNETRD